MWYYAAFMIGMIAGMFIITLCVMAGKKVPEVEAEVITSQDGRMFYSCEEDEGAKQEVTHA